MLFSPPMDDQNQNGHNPTQNGHKPVKKAAKSNGLNPRQQKAADEYMRNGGNKTQAMITAGYSPRSASADGSRLLNQAKVRRYIEAQMAKNAAAAGVTAEAVIGGLARIAFFDPKDVCDKNGRVDWKKAKRNGLTDMIVEIVERHNNNGAGRATYKLAARLPAFEALMRAMGLEKEAAKNPRDAARAALEKLKQEFPDLEPGKHEQIIAKSHGVPIKDLTGDGEPAH